jgi:tryptophan-rich sensory protein
VKKIWIVWKNSYSYWIKLFIIENKMKNKIIKFILSLLFTHGVGYLGSLFVFSEITGKAWYASLVRPMFSPPNWVFGFAWFLLYTLMAIAFYLVWQEASCGNKKAKIALWIFIWHMFFNAIWSWFFFGMHSFILASIDILVVWMFIVLLIFYFWRIRKIASYLLIPYLAWVSFATYLTIGFWFLN